MLFIQHQLRYCIRIAFAQALKASDAEIDDKFCVAGGSANSSNIASVSGECRNSNNGSGNSKKGLSYVFDTVASVSGDKWPNGGGAGKTAKGSNVQNVSEDMIKLSKDEKTVVAGHLAKSI